MKYGLTFEAVAKSLGVTIQMPFSLFLTVARAVGSRTLQTTLGSGQRNQKPRTVDVKATYAYHL